MRVAYVCTDPGIGLHGHKGASVHVTEVVRALRRAGHDVELFVTRVDGRPPDDLADLVVHRLEEIGRGDAAARERRMLVANAGLAAQLDTHGPFDLVYERYSLFSHGSADHARARRIPLVVEVNAPLVDEQARHRDLVHRAAAESATRCLFDTASSLVAVSGPVATWTAHRCAHPERVHVVPNGVDPARFLPAPGPTVRSAPDAPTTIGFVGTLKPWHGVAALVAATARVAADHDVALRIAGNGPGRDDAEDRVSQAGLTGLTTFTGPVRPDDVPAELSRMDIAVAPYTADADDYFSPLKVFEYQAAGLPVVASAVGQVPDLVTHGVSGLTCPPDDVDALATALARLVSDPPMRRAMGRAGRDHVVAHHTWDAVVEQVLATVEPLRLPRAAPPVPVGGG